jgi:hypothetical protein
MSAGNFAGWREQLGLVCDRLSDYVKAIGDEATRQATRLADTLWPRGLAALERARAALGTPQSELFDDADALESARAATVAAETQLTDTALRKTLIANMSQTRVDMIMKALTEVRSARAAAVAVETQAVEAAEASVLDRPFDEVQSAYAKSGERGVAATRMYVAAVVAHGGARKAQLLDEAKSRALKVAPDTRAAATSDSGAPIIAHLSYALPPGLVVDGLASTHYAVEYDPRPLLEGVRGATAVSGLSYPIIQQMDTIKLVPVDEPPTEAVVGVVPLGAPVPGLKGERTTPVDSSMQWAPHAGITPRAQRWTELAGAVIMNQVTAEREALGWEGIRERFINADVTMATPSAEKLMTALRAAFKTRLPSGAVSQEAWLQAVAPEVFEPTGAAAEAVGASAADAAKTLRAVLRGGAYEREVSTYVHERALTVAQELHRQLSAALRDLDVDRRSVEAALRDATPAIMRVLDKLPPILEPTLKLYGLNLLKQI